MSLMLLFVCIHKVAFPPFSHLVDFIYQEARMCGDPSFLLPRTGHAFKTSSRAFISVHKTEVVKDVSSIDDTLKAKADPAKFCPIHKKPHPLYKCRVFREKSLDDRKSFLKQHGVCFKCVALTTYLARDCEKSAQCTECGSERHCSALHPGPVKESTKAPTSPEEDGGEVNIDTPPDTVSSMCTEVCG